MLALRSLLRQLRFGIAVAALIVTGTALYVIFYGPLHGVWGWPELVLGGLATAACIMGGMEALTAQPNKFTRSHTMYDLRDVPRQRELESGGTGWMIQALPSVVIFLVLLGIFLIT